MSDTTARLLRKNQRTVPQGLEQIESETNSRAHRVRLPDFLESLPMALMRGREAVMRYFRPSLRAHKLSEQQWRVLRALASRGATEATELVRATFLHASSLSRILRDLDRRALIQRMSVKSDLRRSVVSISRAGMQLIKAVQPESEAGYEEITRRFGEERLRSLQVTLKELEASLLADLPEESETDQFPDE